MGAVLPVGLPAGGGNAARRYAVNLVSPSKEPSWGAKAAGHGQPSVSLGDVHTGMAL